jgi:hypothetical protein
VLGMATQDRPHSAIRSTHNLSVLKLDDSKVARVFQHPLGVRLPLDPESRTPKPRLYSYLSATIGSTFVARRAGM